MEVDARVRVMRKVGAALALVGLCVSPVAMARTPVRGIDEVAKDLGFEATRGIDDDICFPADSDEYEALGKNAILKINAFSVISAELPLKSVYIIQNGIRYPLHRIAIFDKQSSDSDRLVQTSFYLLPIHFMKVNSEIFADYGGARKNFRIRRFSAKIGLGSAAPAFAWLDEYDAEADADPKALGRVLAREYSSYFK